nr:hypothetical protein [uncultured Rhodopila sp.]
MIVEEEATSEAKTDQTGPESSSDAEAAIAVAIDEIISRNDKEIQRLNQRMDEIQAHLRRPVVI